MKVILERDKTFYKKIFVIALPIIIQNFITSSLNIVDTIMIGKLGEVEIASVGIGNQYFFLFNILIMGMFSGMAVYTSQYWGRKDIASIKKVVGLGSLLAVIIGLIFTVVALISPSFIVSIFNKSTDVIRLGSEYLAVVCLSYVFTALTFNFATALRCIEKTSIPMLVSAVALITNTFLNWVFIFGNLGSPAMGVKGAAIATLIARVLETTILIAYIYISKSVLAGKIKELFSFSRDFVKMIFITMIPVLLNEGCWGLGSVMYNVIYGRIGTQAIASVQIATTVYNLFMVIIFGIGSASLVIVGNEIGRGDKDKGYKYGKKCVALGCIVGVILSLGLILLSNQIVTLYDVSEQVRIWARNILYVIAFIMVIRVYNIIIIVGVLRGGGDAKVSLAIEASTMWFIGVPVAFIGAFILKLPVYQVYALCTLEEIVKGVFCLRRFKSKKWINNLVEQ
ncbi:MAG: MATE family efflux transporter [Clostridium sp.]|uniref:Probable multidrug resistance protein NorM n=1 Tax=Clostridium paraputrificum TaxID=29363 RepID=A0A6N3ATJ4_9CLOT|nr:MATE family efflux transporter [Clostridium sp.]MBS5927408.1 MATE family efflux transporter [Clostridium sp.]MBS5986506.1 MATE family efflux transporter [Clostridium sp.]